MTSTEQHNQIECHITTHRRITHSHSTKCIEKYCRNNDNHMTNQHKLQSLQLVLHCQFMCTPHSQRTHNNRRPYCKVSKPVFYSTIFTPASSRQQGPAQSTRGSFHIFFSTVQHTAGPLTVSFASLRSLTLQYLPLLCRHDISNKYTT